MTPRLSYRDSGAVEVLDCGICGGSRSRGRGRGAGDAGGRGGGGSLFKRAPSSKPNPAKSIERPLDLSTFIA